jgi:hypothetical protein
LADTISKPQEDARLQVPRKFLLGTISGMKEAVHDFVHHLAFHLNKVGILEWEDLKSKKVDMPTAMGTETIHHAVNRNLKHITVVTRVAASKEYLIPCIIPYIALSQESDVLREVLRKKDIQFGCRAFDFEETSETIGQQQVLC